jgi:membrane-bound lytic murein transglycosylase A
MAPVLDPIGFAELAGFGSDDCLAAFQTFLRSAKTLVDRTAPTRPAVAPSPALAAIAREALAADILETSAARAFFERRFQAFRVPPDVGKPAGFLTGYYRIHDAGVGAPR